MVASSSEIARSLSAMVCVSSVFWVPRSSIWVSRSEVSSLMHPARAAVIISITSKAERVFCMPL